MRIKRFMVPAGAVLLGAVVFITSSPVSSAKPPSVHCRTHITDEALGIMMQSLVEAAEIDRNGDLYLKNPNLGPRFLKPASGAYWQISAAGKTPLRSRSLWDRTLPSVKLFCKGVPEFSEVGDFDPAPLRLIMQDVTLPGSEVVWRFTIAWPLSDTAELGLRRDRR